MTQDHPNIADRDWRLPNITTLAKDFESPWSGVVHKAGTPIETVGFIRFQDDIVQIPVPNPSAIYISLAHRTINGSIEKLNALVEKSSDNALKVPADEESQFFDELENLIACVIFSYTAIEAFANESIPDDFEYKKDRSDKRCVEIYSKDQIERHLTLDLKLDQILPDLFSVDSPKGTVAWEGYIWLKRVHDRFVHLKSTDWERSSPDNVDDYVWTRLLSPRVQEAPQIALDLIRHYHDEQVPRWLMKTTQEL